jgi:hypothetical protein
LVVAPGRWGDFAFDWEIAVGGRVRASWAHRGPESEGEPTSEIEECITKKIRTWDFGYVQAPAKAVGWRFEKCGDVGGATTSARGVFLGYLLTIECRASAPCHASSVS